MRHVYRLLTAFCFIVGLWLLVALFGFTHTFYLVWFGFILSAGFACGYVAWRTWQLRNRHRIFRYFGMVKLALLLSTLNGSWALVQALRVRGFEVFDSLSWTAHRGLIVQTIVAGSLWLLALYLSNKIP